MGGGSVVSTENLNEPHKCTSEAGEFPQEGLSACEGRLGCVCGRLSFFVEMEVRAPPSVS